MLPHTIQNQNNICFVTLPGMLCTSLFLHKLTLTKTYYFSLHKQFWTTITNSPRMGKAKTHLWQRLSECSVHEECPLESPWCMELRLGFPPIDFFCFNHLHWIPPQGYCFGCSVYNTARIKDQPQSPFITHRFCCGSAIGSSFFGNHHLLYPSKPMFCELQER